MFVDTMLLYTLCCLLLLVFTLAVMSLSKSSTEFRPPPSPPTLPIIGHLHLLGSVMPKSFQNLARLYGPLMQLQLGASTIVIVSNAQVAREIMKTNELNFSHRPHFGSRDYFQYKGSDFVTAPYGPYWRFMKKLCITQLLSSSQLGRFMQIREQERKKLLETLMDCSNEGRACDLSLELTALTNNILCRMAMSTTCLEKCNDAEELHGLVREFLEVAAKLSVGEILGPLGKLDLFGYGKRVKKIVAKFDEIVERIMKEHEEKDSKDCVGGGKDMMDILLETYRDPNAEVRLTRNDIKAFFLDIILAGTDTTSVALQWGMAEIINHPHVLTNLRAEIHSVVGPTRLVKESDVPNLPYLQAVVKELLRLHPSAPFVLRQSAEDCMINGYDLRAQTRAVINVYAIMRDPEAWINPEKFIPERHLINKVGEINGRGERVMETKGQDFTYVPFGKGRRGCPGESLALAVVQPTIGALIQCFDWKVKGGDKVDIEEGSSFSAGPAKPLVCYPIARSRLF